MLLEHWDAADPLTHLDVPGPNERLYTLLSEACGSAHIETVRFLLDGPWQAAYGDLHARTARGSTALLATAGSFRNLEKCQDTADKENHLHQNYLARVEEVMQLLLDRGACVQDTLFQTNESQEPWETVLGLAISRASPALVKRLINQGADMYVKMACISMDRSKITRGVTALHIGSQYSNAGGIQVLLDYARGTGGIGIVQQADGDGHLPLHYAAYGLEDSVCYMLEEEEIVPHVTATIELLLRADPSTVNAQDKEGDTALHFAVRRHGHYGNRHLAIPQLLCKYGADGSLRGRNGETALHGLGYRVPACDPFDISLIDLLLDHGASVDDTDRDGNTPLHFAARNWLYIEAARHLLSRGANLSAIDQQGNTPLHQAANGSRNAFKTLRSGPFLAEPLVEAQSEMMKVLLNGVSVETADALMDQPNADNKTPRQICKERRIKWQEDEEAMRNRATGQNWGRGRGVGGVRGGERGGGRGRGGRGG